MDHAGRVGTGQPSASSTTARNENVSPARTSLREGRTSSRAGSPGEPVQCFAAAGCGGGVAGAAVGAALAAGAALADALAAGVASPSRFISVNDRVRVTDAVQFWSWMTNWYWPVSCSEMVESVAWTVVTMVAR